MHLGGGGTVARMAASEIRVPIRKGTTAAGTLCLPEGAAPAAGLVVCHEWYGLTDPMRAMVERFAGEGFVALGVDLYGGRVAANDAEAAELANELDTAKAMKIVRSACDWLRGHPRGNGKVGVTGFCLGGAMALAAACTLKSLGAAVPFYGLPRAEHAKWTRAKVPIQGHYASHDAFVTPERVTAAHAEALAAGAKFELHFYPANHAFLRVGDPHVYDREAAELAWSRAIEFLHRHLD